MSISLGLSLLVFSPFGGLTEVVFKEMNLSLHRLKSIILSGEKMFDMYVFDIWFVSYYVNIPPELLRSFFVVSVVLGLGVVRGDSWSTSKSEPCKSNQLSHFFSDKMFVNENTFSKSHSIMRNLNWKQKPFVYYEVWGMVVTCHPLILLSFHIYFIYDYSFGSDSRL